MERKQVVVIMATATIMGWGVVMAALGREDAVAVLAPVLAVVVQQVIPGRRDEDTVTAPGPAPAPAVEQTAPERRSHTEPSSGHRVIPVPDKEDRTP
ncbi:hypothetical protein [Streptomyces nitrosporeus]|uniref:hypothetical protein n=1 Tax=Streptomyces nitrosporeus TaxID=28894 RepID=UPI00167D97DB|nr:hypothetical protein [Streptomyces nitrosporeus]GGZ18231.1 hypothetical protein GCM10010327_56630 [Streptomyces nitrosporeus]